MHSTANYHYSQSENSGPSIKNIKRRHRIKKFFKCNLNCGHYENVLLSKKEIVFVGYLEMDPYETILIKDYQNSKAEFKY